MASSADDADRRGGLGHGSESKLNLLAFVALLLAVIALSRTGKRGDLPQRVKRLEEELARLRERLGGAPLPAEEREADEAAAGVPAAPTIEQPVVQPAEPTIDALREPPRELDVTMPTPPPSQPESPPFFSQVDWERWLGVRGAAVLGGAALALAGLFFFRYSIEHGLIPPWLRVVLGVLVGIGAIAAAEWSLRKRYAGTANALAGGGLVILYAAFWAAGNLYELIPLPAVFVLMVVVTVAGCALSWRHESLVIAVIGLIGGFLTPVFASRGSDNPIGLFAYVLLLDAGVMLLARRMRWPVLALLALAGTTAYQMLWIGGRMGPDRILLGLAILAVFALLFTFVGSPDAAEKDSAQWRWSQRAGVLLPLVSAIYFAANTDLDTDIVPLGGLLVLLGLAAGWLARQHREGRLALGAAAASLGVMIVWVLQPGEDLGGMPWRAALIFAALAVAHHVAVELTRSEDEDGALFKSLANAATVVGFGLLVLLVFVGAFERVSLWPLLVGWIAIAEVLVRQGTFPGRGWVQILAAIGVGAGLALYRLNNSLAEIAPTYAPVLPTMLLVALGWQGLALLQARLESRRFAEHAASAIALVLLLGRIPDPSIDALTGLLVPLALGFFTLLAASRLGGGRWMLVATVATALAQLAWVLEIHPEPSTTGLIIAFLSAGVFTGWPLAVASRLRDDPWSWRAAALSGLIWLPAILTLFEDRFGDAAIGLVPLALGALSLGAAAGARNLWLADDASRTSALAWLCGVALSLLTIAIPLQVEKEWITIGWALEGAAMLALWTRLDHPGLKYTALALLLAATVRLIGNPDVLVYYPRPAWRIFNWISYAYLVPAAALIASARLLAPLEVPRLRDWEKSFYLRERPWAAGACGIAALLVVFVWINLTIADWFSPADQLRLFAARTPTEKLVLSIAWALYAVVLLTLGVRLKSSSLRWASLVLMMVTIGKIFLYDVGELTDLYRVASLLGLALSLIVVSLVYQRFVFRSVPEGQT